jgi:uncharacterized membrane protein YkoI
MIIARVLFASAAFSALMFAADTKVKLESLSPALQAAVKAQTANATLVNISMEKENGKTEYEVETQLNGKSHNLTFDQKGALLEVEDETDLNSIPAAAKAAIQRQAGAAAILKVEKVTAGSKITYEAAMKSKAGKNFEVVINADGSLKSKEDGDNEK